MGCAIILHVGQILLAVGAKVILYVIEYQLYKQVDCACKSMDLNFISNIKQKVEITCNGIERCQKMSQAAGLRRVLPSTELYSQCRAAFG